MFTVAIAPLTMPSRDRLLLRTGVISLRSWTANWLTCMNPLLLTCESVATRPTRARRATLRHRTTVLSVTMLPPRRLILKFPNDPAPKRFRSPRTVARLAKI